MFKQLKSYSPPFKSKTCSYSFVTFMGPKRSVDKENFATERCPEQEQSSIISYVFSTYKHARLPTGLPSSDYTVQNMAKRYVHQILGLIVLVLAVICKSHFHKPQKS
jgi:hypothetical protein